MKICRCRSAAPPASCNLQKSSGVSVLCRCVGGSNTVQGLMLRRRVICEQCRGISDALINSATWSSLIIVCVSILVF